MTEIAALRQQLRQLQTLHAEGVLADDTYRASRAALEGLGPDRTRHKALATGQDTGAAPSLAYVAGRQGFQPFTDAANCLCNLGGKMRS